MTEEEISNQYIRMVNIEAELVQIQGEIAKYLEELG